MIGKAIRTSRTPVEQAAAVVAKIAQAVVAPAEKELVHDVLSEMIDDKAEIGKPNAELQADFDSPDAPTQRL